MPCLPADGAVAAVRRDAVADAGAAHIRLRPPFRIVWTRGLGTLIEFPAVVADGVAYIGNARATVRAISMRFGKVLWRRDTPGGKMASSPAVVGDDLVFHTMDGWVLVLDRATGRSAGATTSARRSSRRRSSGDGVDYFGAWNGRSTRSTCSATGCAGHATLGAKITSSAALAGGTLFIGDYGGRLSRSTRATGAARWVALGQRADLRDAGGRRGRVFVPSSTGGSLTAFSTSGPLPLARRERALRLLVAGDLGRARLLRLLQRRLLLRLGARAAASSGRSAPAARSPAPPSSSTASPTPAASRTSIVGVDARSGRVLLRSRTGTTSRSPATGCACSSTATRGCTRSSRGRGAALTYLSAAMRRLLKGLAALAVLLAGAVAAVVIHRLQAEKDIHGSSTEEFSCRRRRSATPPPRRTSRGPSTASTATRDARRCSSRCARRSAQVWTYGAGSLVEFPPAIGYGRLYFSTNAGSSSP